MARFTEKFFRNNKLKKFDAIQVCRIWGQSDSTFDFIGVKDGWTLAASTNTTCWWTNSRVNSLRTATSLSYNTLRENLPWPFSCSDQPVIFFIRSGKMCPFNLAELYITHFLLSRKYIFSVVQFATRRFRFCKIRSIQQLIWEIFVKIKNTI